MAFSSSAGRPARPGGWGCLILATQAVNAVAEGSQGLLRQGRLYAEDREHPSGDGFRPGTRLEPRGGRFTTPRVEAV